MTIVPQIKSVARENEVFFLVEIRLGIDFDVVQHPMDLNLIANECKNAECIEHKEKEQMSKKIHTLVCMKNKYQETL